MKIIIISQYNPFASSSAQNNRFLSITEGLVQQGVILKIFVTDGYRSLREKNVFRKQGQFKQIEYKYLSYFNFSSRINRKLFRYFISPTKIAGKIDKVLYKELDIDYLWFLMFPNIMKIYENLSNKIKNIKIVHERSEYSWININNKKWHNVYLKEFLPKVSIFIVMTQTLKKYYQPFLNKNTKIIHLPMTVDLSRFINVRKQDEFSSPYIAYCGTMNNAKDGVDILIKAFLKIKQKYPNLSLILAGPTIPLKDYNEQQKFIKQNRLSDSVVYLGNIEREEIPSFLLSAEVLAMARPNSKQAEGGFPTKLGEYLATGKPVCVTNVGEIKKYLTDGVNAFIAKPDSVESFAEILKRAIINEQSVEIGRNGQKVAEKCFSAKLQSEKLFKFLKSEI